MERTKTKRARKTQNFKFLGIDWGKGDSQTVLSILKRRTDPKEKDLFNLFTYGITGYKVDTKTGAVDSLSPEDIENIISGKLTLEKFPVTINAK